jgi:hypothetical protein
MIVPAVEYPALCSCEISSELVLPGPTCTVSSFP